MSNPKVIISISRQFGSGGREIGQELAEILNIPFYDKKKSRLSPSRAGSATSFLKKQTKRLAAACFIRS